eukprot:TRINITY_DN10028_c0_g1_i1.p1 TRINITY_DN10028_c0_g1~~TRINITY_DN10028_c0_g1_i1.p1  ORF type:complete len:456 (+),score=54.49 TRINITY_DN10028_c0_g1_i1:139-1506(+)
MWATILPGLVILLADHRVWAVTKKIEAEGTPASCLEGTELNESPAGNEVDNCVCEKYHLFWPSDKRCYREFTRGPCPQGHRFVWDPVTQGPICSCPTFWARYTDGRCYEEYTQGPCEVGTVIMMDKDTSVGFCGCNKTLRMYYHADTNLCYELYTRGPCPLGHILSFNYTTLQPECKCHDGFHFHEEDGACYELNTPGPCPIMEHCDTGTPCFMKSMDTLQTGCRCLPKNSLTPQGKCFQPYTRGPCKFGEWFVFHDGQGGQCEEKKYCKRFDNWHWWAPDQRCYRQFTQGPCQRGKLFYLDTDANGSGCHCRKDWDAYYWAPLDQCFEQESPGPCKAGQYFAYNTTSRQTECSCFKNHVYSPTSQSCIEIHTQGPCPAGQVVVQDSVSSNLACDCGSHLLDHYWAPTNRCYPLYGQGPCRDGEQFRLVQSTFTGSEDIVSEPACVVWGGPAKTF